MTTIVKMLELSTAHVTGDTAQSLNAGHFLAYQKGEYGWFVPVLAFDLLTEPCPIELAWCFNLATERGCDWIMFDRDCDMVPGLPVFEW